MKFSTAVIAAVTPLVLTKSVHNHYQKRDDHLVVEEIPHAPGFQVGSVTHVIIIWANPGAGAVTTTYNDMHQPTPAPVHEQQPPPVEAPPVEAPPVEAPPADPVQQPPPEQVAPPAGVQTHKVTVGGPAGLVYTPDQITANVGDMVVFTFLGQNHTVSQSTFDTPCVAMDGGMDTGFQSNPDNTIVPAPQVAMQVMVDTPLWFYCQQGPHCGKGMTFSINPTAEKTHAMFQSMAIQQNGAGGGSAITGGEAPPAAADPNPVAPPAGTGVASPTGSGDVIAGQGTVLPDGSCSCAVVVGAGAFPAVGAQGIGNYGGMAGSLPIEAAEAI